MKTKRRLLPVLAGIALLSMGIVSCGGSDVSNTTTGNPTATTVSEPGEEEKIEITAADNKKEIQVGDTLQLSASVDGVAWSTKNTEVVSVSATGLVTALNPGSARITAKKEGYANGNITITVLKAPEREPNYTLRLEEAEHYDPDDFWGIDLSAWGMGIMGPGDSPVEDNNGATDDGTSLGYLQAGCKETMRFTCDKAVTVEMGVTMAYNAEMSLDGVISVKFNGKEISMAGKVVEGPEDGDTNNYYDFHAVSFGNVDLVKGENVLEIEMIAQAPNMDKVVFYTNETLTITSIPAAVKPKIEVVEADLEVEVGSTVQIEVKDDLTDLVFTSANDAIATVDASGLVTGVAKGKTTIEVSKEGYKKATVNITVKKAPVANEVVLEAEDAVLPEGSAIQVESGDASSGGKSIGYFSAGQTFELKYTAEEAVEAKLTLVAAACSMKEDYSGIADMDLAAAMELKLNDTAISLTGKTLPGTDGWNFQNWQDVDLGTVNLIKGENVFTFTALAQGPNIDCLKLTLPGSDTGSGSVTVTPVADNTADETGVTYLEFENGEFTRPDGANEAQNLVVEESDTAHGLKSLGYFNAGNSVSLKFTASAAGEVEFRMTAASANGSFDFSTFTMSVVDHEIATVMTASLNGEAIDLSDIILPGNDTGSYQNWQDVNFGKIKVKEGENVLTFASSGQGPNLDCVKLTGSETVVLS